MKKCMMALLAAGAAIAACAADDADAFVDGLLSKMTTGEKIAQLNMTWTDVPTTNELKRALAAGEVGTLIWFWHDPAAYNEYQKIAVEKSRQGIPFIACFDVIHGQHLVFPIAPALAGAFEPELFEKAQAFAAKEARSEGIALSFAPMCDTARDLRWGRVAETCGEDPYLNAVMCAAQVRGFQGDDISSPVKVASCLKHFCGYSSVNGGRDYNDADSSVWTFRNLHFIPFRAAVEAGASMVMTSFNTIDGYPAVSHPRLQNGILRGEWGFAGPTVSDWASVREQIVWGFAKNEVDASAMALSAGNDIDMCTGFYMKGIPEALKRGDVDIKEIDAAARRVLMLKYKLGLFKNPYVDESLAAAVKKESDGPMRAFARECASRSTVLVKNDGTLPLARDGGTIAVIGPFATELRELAGTWCFNAGPVTTSIGDAVKEAFPNRKVDVVPGCGLWEMQVKKSLNDGTMDAGPGAAVFSADIEKAVAAAKAADVVVMAVGEPAAYTGENGSRNLINLTGRQQELFDAVASAGTPIVTIVISGRPLAIPTVWEKSSAVFYAWQPGTEGARGIADLVSGAVSPSARLTMSVPRDATMLPVYYNHPVTGRPGEGMYHEVLDDKTTIVAYPFGHGLTYTSFEYSNCEVSGGKVSATVKNTGSREGTETVQFYVRQHVCRQGVRPVRELRGFKRVTLAPGESETVSFDLTDEALGYWTRDGHFRRDVGKYTLWISKDSESGEGVEFVNVKR